MFGRKTKPTPRIILRKTNPKSEQNAQISTAILEDCQEGNVQVLRGLAFYKRNRNNGNGRIEEGKWPSGKGGNGQMGGGGNVILPGLAEQIESYPCPICANEDRVFMTRAGLEKHAEKEHSGESLAEIRELAEQIQKEWERRKNGIIVKMDIGQIALGPAGSRNINSAQKQRKTLFFGGAIDSNIGGSNGWADEGIENERFKCDFCNSIFSEERQLWAHIQQLNHFTQRGQFGDSRGEWPKKAGAPHPPIHPIYRGCPARVQCEICGLAMVRPSLIIRHMIRVHNRPTNFGANVTYPDSSALPPLNYRIERDGNLVWNCCAEDFHDKEILLAHRSQAHPIQQPNPLLPILAIQQPTEIAYSTQDQPSDYLVQNYDAGIFGEHAEGIETPFPIGPNLYPADIGLFGPEMTLAE